MSEHVTNPSQEFIDRKRRGRMATIDALPSDIRALVHEYGYNVVKTCMDLGIRQPRQITHVVETILDEFSPTRGSFSAQGIRVPMLSPKKQEVEA